MCSRSIGGSAPYGRVFRPCHPRRGNPMPDNDGISNQGRYSSLIPHLPQVRIPSRRPYNKRGTRIGIPLLLWSERQDSNLRPFDPQSNALPSCATPRYCLILLFLVPAIGVEPIRCCHHGILSPARLPIPSRRHNKAIIAQPKGEIKKKTFANL